MSNSCENCNYYREGSCRKHAPSPAGVGASRMARWPLVDKKDWCGDWDATELAKIDEILLRMECSSRTHRMLFGTKEESEKAIKEHEEAFNRALQEGPLGGER